MKLKQYQVDAFAERVFEGNPAAVCPLDAWLEDGLLQSIAMENNLSETAFFVPTEDGFHIRWFTPVAEVDLCGHATLAAAHVIFAEQGYALPEIVFQSHSGALTVSQGAEGTLVMDFPAVEPVRCAPPPLLGPALGRDPAEVWQADDFIAVYEHAEHVRALRPDFARMRALGLRGVVATAPGDGEYDFVSRFFAPKYGIPEDPVTGSAHCALTPYWAQRLRKSRFLARQVSRRGGTLLCELQGKRVLISGRAVKFSSGEITLPAPTSAL